MSDKMRRPFEVIAAQILLFSWASLGIYSTFSLGMKIAGGLRGMGIFETPEFDLFFLLFLEIPNIAIFLASSIGFYGLLKRKTYARLTTIILMDILIFTAILDVIGYYVDSGDSPIHWTTWDKNILIVRILAFLAACVVSYSFLFDKACQEFLKPRQQEFQEPPPIETYSIEIQGGD